MFEHADNTIYFRTRRRRYCRFKRKKVASQNRLPFFVFYFPCNLSAAHRIKSAFDIPDAAIASFILASSSGLNGTTKRSYLPLFFPAYLLSAAFCASLLATVANSFFILRRSRRQIPSAFQRSDNPPL